MALLALGGLTSVIFFLQPWRSCDYEDTATGCAMLPNDAAMITAALIVVVIGLTLIFIDYGQRLRSTS